jgi:hypothetical protein
VRILEGKIYIRLYRVIDVPDENVKSDLDRLAEFIKNRSANNKDLSYITLTYIRKHTVDGLIVIGGEKDKAEKEAEIILGFIGSELEGIMGRRITNPKIGEVLPLPAPKRFL